MIEIVIPNSEYYDDATNEFMEINETVLKMEHSLVSINEWESKWGIAFLGKEGKTDEQALDYLKCMTVYPDDIKLNVYKMISKKDMERISEYIKAPMTATTFYDAGSKNSSREVITSEIIYYWMITLNIPMEFQHAHLNKLLTLIRTVSVKNTPPKKMSQSQTLKMYSELNAKRRRQLNTRG